MKLLKKFTWNERKSIMRRVLGLSVVVELEALNGRNKFDFPVFSEVKY